MRQSGAPLLEWLAAGRTLGQAKVWMFGMHGWDTARFSAIESAAAAQRLHLTFTANVWIATPEGWNLTMTEEKLLNKLGITLQR